MLPQSKIQNPKSKIVLPVSLRLGKLISILGGYLLPTGAVLLFLFLWIKSQAVVPEQHQRYISKLRRIQELDALVNQNILQTRLGLLLYYDPIVQELAQIKQIQADLQQIPLFVDADGQQTINQAIQAHIQVCQDKEKRIDRFKSQQAVLSNSLAFFPIAIADLTTNPTTNPALVERLDTLLRNILLFNLSTSLELKPQIEQQIQQILTDARSTAQRADVERAIAHAQIILERRPQVNDLINTMLAQPTRVRGEEIAQAYYGAYQQALDTANLYRLGLYLLSTVMTIAIAASIIWKLHTSAIALQQSESKLRMANHAKSQFLSHMSHELRTPLSVILGFTQLLNRSAFDPKQQEYLDTISRSGEHLLTLINDVLEMSKIEADKITLNEQDFNLHHLLDGLQQMFQFKATSKGLQFTVSASPDLPQYIRTDESKLRQVLVNLVGNAVKFTQAGSVTLRVNRGHGEEYTNAQSLPIALLFEIEDTGVGIAPEDLDRLFKPFVQTEAGRTSQEGTGLGLSISHKFVQLMGGNISVESDLGKGTRFRFNIQAESIEADVIPQPTTSRQVIGIAAGQPTYRIMIVEDKPSNRQLLCELLKPVGFDVREAENGLLALKSQHWEPHLIWMDLRMPVMDGIDATKQIKSSGKAPVIIALTGSAFEEERQVALDAGCDDLVRKPFRAEVIFEKMTQYLGVRYVYAETEESSGTEEENPSTSSLILNPSSLTVMPPEWIKQLHQAAICVNAKLLHQLIEQIPESHAPVAHAIAHLIDNFQFEEIVTLTEPEKNSH